MIQLLLLFLVALAILGTLYYAYQIARGGFIVLALVVFTVFVAAEIDAVELSKEVSMVIDSAVVAAETFYTKMLDIIAKEPRFHKIARGMASLAKTVVTRTLPALRECASEIMNATTEA